MRHQPRSCFFHILQCYLTRLLFSLDWNDKDLTGRIPRSVQNLDALKKLCLGRNELEGPIPLEIGKLKNLTELDLKYNTLTGEIPDLSECENLSTLLLQGNEGLNNKLPSRVEALERLTWINLPKAGLQIKGELGKDKETVFNIWRSLEGDEDVLRSGNGEDITKWKGVKVESGRVTRLGEFPWKKLIKP